MEITEGTIAQVCPVCKRREVAVEEHLAPMEHSEITCSRCGYFWMTHDAIEEIDTLGSHEGLRVATWLRHRTDRGDRVPLLVSRGYKKQQEDAHVFTLADVLSANFPRTVPETLARVLLALSTEVEPGEMLSLSQLNHFRYFSKDAAQMSFYFGALAGQGFLERPVIDGRNQITFAGWDAITRLRGVGPDTKQTFVAMSFDPSLFVAWKEGLYRGVDGAGFAPYRVDRDEHNDKIDDRIVAEIRRSRFVVADVTLHRQGVYFEAGYAMGHGLPVIWTCREDELEKCHFDVRQYNYVVWKDPAELAAKLETRIRATI